MKKLVLPPILAIVLILGLVACGGGSDEEPSATDTTSQPEPSPEEEEEEEPDPSLACLDVPAAKTKLKVTTPGFFFKPKKLEAPAGRMVTVVFTNEDSAPHSFTLEDESCDTNPLLGETARATFKMPAQPLGFFCTVHTGMRGKLIPT